MKRKTSQLPTRVLAFGALPPTKNADVVWSQLRAANAYQNKLTELELKRRKAYREARAAAAPELASLEARLFAASEEVERLIKETLAERARDKSRTAASLELKAAKSARREIAALVKAERARLSSDPSVKAAAAHVDEEDHAARLAARAETECYWGTYLLVEAAAQQSARSKVDPGFRGFRGEGRIGAHFSGGLSVEDLFAGKSNMLQIDPLPSGQWDTRSGRRNAKTTARIRVKSDGRAPVWAEFPVLLHRPIPSGARIKDAWVLVRKCGPRSVFSLQLVCEAEDFLLTACGRGSVGIDLGWRKMHNGIRVAVAVGSDGAVRECVVSGVDERLEHASQIRSVADEVFNAALPLVSKIASELDSEEATQAAEHAGQWRAHRKLIRFSRIASRLAIGDTRELWKSWRVARKEAGLDLLGSLEESQSWAAEREIRGDVWHLECVARKLNHLYEWESNERAGALRHRKDSFRKFAAELRETYHTVVLEKFDLRKFAQAADVEAPSDDGARIRRQRNTAAPGEFRQALVVAFGKARVVEVSAVDTTRACAECGNSHSEREPSMLAHRCPSCGAVYDQDVNAARNILSRESEGSSPEAVGARESSIAAE